MTFNLFNNSGKQVATNSSNSKSVTQSVTANVVGAVDSFLKSVRNSYSGVLAFFTRPSTLSMNNGLNSGNSSPPIDTGGGGSGDVSPPETPNGIAVADAGGTSALDEAVKQKIKDSFSDEVQVSPDKSGTAGVITPIFRESKGKDFIYVMVPVSSKP